jgi:hypothetical protein
MRLSELVSNLTPDTYAQLALLLFLGVFVAIAWRHRRLTHRSHRGPRRCRWPMTPRRARGRRSPHE